MFSFGYPAFLRISVLNRAAAALFLTFFARKIPLLTHFRFFIRNLEFAAPHVASICRLLIFLFPRGAWFVIPD
jgi:hypothetical protein